MAEDRGKQRTARERTPAGKAAADRSHERPATADPDAAERSTRADRGPDPARPLNPIPDIMRRALSLGLSGFFLTEEAVRKALGDTIPRDWTDFLLDQSERTRAEFLERLSFEIGRALENVDVAAVLTELLEGRTLEVKAEIRLGGKEDRGAERSRPLQVAVSRGKGAE